MSKQSKAIIECGECEALTRIALGQAHAITCWECKSTIQISPPESVWDESHDDAYKDKSIPVIERPGGES